MSVVHVDWVLKTPLFESVKHDRIVWAPEPRGQYNVRSAYKFCMNNIVEVDHLWVAGNWPSLWKLEVPPKVKNFSWRLCRGVLPTRDNFRRKGVEVTWTCPWCDSLMETTCHLFAACPKSEAIWRARGCGIWSSISCRVWKTLVICFCRFCQGWR